MIRTVDQLKGLELMGEDGPIGSLEDVYFDHEEWRLRHVVVFTGPWLSGRWIVVPAPLLGKVDPVRRVLPIAAARARIGAAPMPETDRPMNRIFERALFAHYGFAPYWVSTGPAGAEAVRSNLLSAEELKGYHVAAKDGDVGRIEDYLVEEDGWDIRYLCVAARRWLSGRRMAAPTGWIHMISWRHKQVILSHLREEIRQAPDYGGPGSLTAKYSRSLEDYYANSCQVPWTHQHQ